jgi:hypothetical protein
MLNSPIQLFDVQADNSATRQTDCKCFIIAVSEGDHATGRVFANDGKRFAHHSPFNATTAH